MNINTTQGEPQIRLTQFEYRSLLTAVATATTLSRNIDDEKTAAEYLAAAAQMRKIAIQYNPKDEPQ